MDVVWGGEALDQKTANGLHYYFSLPSLSFLARGWIALFFLVPRICMHRLGLHCPDLLNNDRRVSLSFHFICFSGSRHCIHHTYSIILTHAFGTTVIYLRTVLLLFSPILMTHIRNARSLVCYSTMYEIIHYNLFSFLLSIFMHCTPQCLE